MILKADLLERSAAEGNVERSRHNFYIITDPSSVQTSDKITPASCIHRNHSCWTTHNLNNIAQALAGCKQAGCRRSQSWSTSSWRDQGAQHGADGTTDGLKNQHSPATCAPPPNAGSSDDPSTNATTASTNERNRREGACCV